MRSLVISVGRCEEVMRIAIYHLYSLEVLCVLQAEGGIWHATGWCLACRWSPSLVKSIKLYEVLELIPVERVGLQLLEPL